jgi:dephospho-CoA kinase
MNKTHSAVTSRTPRKNRHTPIIVITGGTGGGKSLVAREFAHLGARVVDVDQVARNLLKPGTAAWQDCLVIFAQVKFKKELLRKPPFTPNQFTDFKGKPLRKLPWLINSRGEIQRQALADVVFKHPRALKKLNRIVHPYLLLRLHEIIADQVSTSSKPLVLDLAIQPEPGFRQVGEIVLWVNAPQALRLKRLVKDRRLSRIQALQRIHSQYPDAVYQKNADFKLSNRGTRLQLKKQAREIWPRLLAAAAGEVSICRP